MRRAVLIAAVLAPMFPGAGHAQITPDRAAALQGQIKSWLDATLGVATDPRAVTVAAAVDHFDIGVPLSSAPGAPVMTGKMTETGSGRWAVDDVTVPSPSVFRYRLPAAEKPGAAEGEAVTTLTIGRQQQRMSIDPSFATPSTLNGTFGDMGLTTQLADTIQASHVDSAVTATTILPAAAGRVDVATDSTLTGYTAKMSGVDKQPMAISVGKAALVSSLSGVSRERMAQVVRIALQAGRADGQAARPAARPLDHEAARALLTAVGDLANTGVLDQRLSDVTVATGALTVALKQLAIGLDFKKADDKLQARMPLAAEGLSLPDLGLGAMAQLVPSRLSFTPTISGVPTAALDRFARKLVDNQDPDDRDVAALFGQGPINAGIDALHLDVAGSSFAGTVAMLIAAPNAIAGTGRITAENIDRLQQAMSANPQTAQMTPVVIFLKGIGRAEQDRLVWDIVYRDGRVLVNGQDMAALTGGASPAPAPNRPQGRAPTARP